MKNPGKRKKFSDEEKKNCKITNRKIFLYLSIRERGGRKTSVTNEKIQIQTT